MALNVTDYAHRRRGSVWERELARELRQLPEPERFQFIAELLKHNPVALKLANSCLRERRYFEQLLRHGLDTADARSIESWLECVVPRLGFKRVIALLLAEMDRNTQAVDQAIYYLRGFAPYHDSRAWHALQELIALVASKGGRGAMINYQQQGIVVREADPAPDERDVETLNGSVVFFGTEVPIQALFDYLARGENLDQFIDQFPMVRREQALAVLSAAGGDARQNL